MSPGPLSFAPLNVLSLGRLGVWGHLDRLSAARARDYARRVEELGFAALWVPETVAREPFALLAQLACATERIGLGTSIASIWARDPVTMRMSAMTVHEASGGRFVLGLGVSHRHLTEKVRGHRYEKPLTRMREYVAGYRAAIYRGPVDGERPEPSVVVAALRERMLELAAREADGAFPYLVTSERIEWMRARLDAVTGTADDPTGTAARPTEADRAEAGPTRPGGAGGVRADADGVTPRERKRALLVTLPVVLEREPAAAREAARAYLGPYLRAPNYQASWMEQGFEPLDWEKPGSDRLVDAMVAWGDESALRQRIDRMHDAGADHVALIPLAPDGSTEHLDALDALAPGSGNVTPGRDG